MNALKSVSAKASVVNSKAIAEMPSEGAVKFLQRMFAGRDGYVSVVAFKIDAEESDPDKIKARTVPISEIASLGHFIEQFNGKRNLCYSLNPLKTAVKSKAAKNDVLVLASLQVDIDPRDNYPLHDERARISAMIEKCPAPPSAVIDSGSGY